MLKRERRWKKMKGPEKIISDLIISITETLRMNAVVRIKINKNTVQTFKTYADYIQNICRYCPTTPLKNVDRRDRL